MTDSAMYGLQLGQQIPLPGCYSIPETLPPAETCLPGIAILTQGELPRSVSFLETGMLKSYHRTDEGKQVSTRLWLPGSILGSESILLGTVSWVTVTPLVPSRLRKLPAQEFLSRIGKDSTLSRRVHEHHARQIREFVCQAVESRNCSARDRLESILHTLARTQMQTNRRCIRVHLPLKHSEIAQIIEVTPEHFSRLLKRLEQEKIIRRRNGWIYIRKPEALRSDLHFSIPPLPT